MASKVVLLYAIMPQAIRLPLRLLMHRVLPAKTAKLLELKFPLHGLHVLARIVIDPLAHGTFELDEVFGKLGF